MKALIVYDSMYGNTEQIAQSIGNDMAGDVKVFNVAKANPSEMESMFREGGFQILKRVTTKTSLKARLYPTLFGLDLVYVMK